MPMTPRTRARAAKATNREVIDRGVETASDTIAGIGRTAVTGASWFKDDVSLRTDSCNWSSSAAERITRVISAGTRPFSRVAPVPYGTYKVPFIHGGTLCRR